MREFLLDDLLLWALTAYHRADRIRVALESDPHGPPLTTKDVHHFLFPPVWSNDDCFQDLGMPRTQPNGLVDTIDSCSMYAPIQDN